jgi:ABC-2 type transport system ATP-binding protein
MGTLVPGAEPAPDATVPAIAVRALQKRFDAKPVLDGVDFEVRPGEILGYVGPNGAGKSTTIKILLGLMPDFQGEVRVAGHDPRRAPLEVKRAVGYVAENAVLYDPLTVAEFLLFVGRIHRLDDRLIEHRAMGCLSALELDDRADSRIGELSKGMRQKVLLTAALLHAPSVLLLDEPLSGLDVSSQLLVKEIVRRLAGTGRAILFSSHVMDVVERLCTRIAILSEGRIVAQGTFDELAASGRGGSLEGIFARLTGDDDVGARAEGVVAAITS